MNTSRLAEALSSLSRTELRQFSNFLRSPYFNNRSEVTRFYEGLKPYYPKFDLKKPDLESIFTKVYPKKKFSDVLMRKLFSLTINLFTEFITINGFREDKLEFNIRMLDNLREKKLPRLFEKKSPQFSDLLQRSPNNIGYYEAKLKYTSILNGHFLNTNEKSMVSRLQNEFDDFIEYFLTVVFLLYIRLSEWSRGMNVKFDLKFHDEVINYFSTQRKGDVSLAALYYNMLMLLNTEDEKYYYDLMECRNKFEKKLAKIDDFNIAIVSMQFCHKKVMKGHSEYRKHQLDINKKMLKKNLIPAGFVDPYFFTNTVRNAVNLKEYKWSENFINEYKERLNPGIANEIIDYSHAMIEFGKGKYENSLMRLSQINIERSNIKLDIRNLMIMNYYELDYKLELESLIDSYKHYLQRDKTINPLTKDMSSLFVNFVSDLVKVNQKRNKNSLHVLKKTIAAESHFNMKDWLIKKLDELK
ncbi:MAG: hypothetical protein ABI528_01065 [bacterium]